MSMRSWIRSLFTRRALEVSRKAPRGRLSLEALERREVLDASTQWLIGNGTYNLAQTFQLHSNPTAQHVVYLDFDGHTNGDVEPVGSAPDEPVDNWDNIISPAYDPESNGASFTDTEMKLLQRIWARVAEDFAPFNIDVTTQEPDIESLRKDKNSDTDDRWGIRVVITPDDTPRPGSGGVAWRNSFTLDTDTPCYVFNQSERGVAECVSHEVGHSLGLAHDGTPTLEYFQGQGSGPTSWGPIMGAAYTPSVTQWSRGEYSQANNPQDDLAIITANNGFTYRNDDFGNTAATAYSLGAQGSYQVNTTYGLIERNTDADYFSVWAGTGLLSLKVDTAPLGPNLAVRADLYDAAGNLLTTVNPSNALNAVVDYHVTTAGQYFLKVSGVGKGDPATNGFSNYASLGNYRVSGSVSTKGFTTVANADISNKPNVTVLSNYTVSGMTGTLQDVNVRINLTHTWVSDLEITLIAPSGTRIPLFSHQGGSGDNLVNTIFDDSAATTIGNGSAPFTGSFRPTDPTKPLALLIGKNPNGKWTLEVKDTVKGDGGKLVNWTLSLNTGSSSAALAESGLASSQSLAGNGPASGASPRQGAAASSAGAVDAAFLLSTAEGKRVLPSNEWLTPFRFDLPLDFDSIPGIELPSVKQTPGAGGRSATAHAMHDLMEYFKQIDEWQGKEDIWDV